MQRIGLWHITQDGPRKLEAGRVDLEQYLEDWIARDPSLLQQGLVIVGRHSGWKADAWICWGLTHRDAGP